jgi:hypothetical protein
MSANGRAAQTTQQDKPQTPQEILQALERDLQIKLQELGAARELLSKHQEQVINAQDAVFRSYQLLTINKERFLVNMVNEQRERLRDMSQEITKSRASKTAAPLPTIQETPAETTTPVAREDNLTVIANE